MSYIVPLALTLAALFAAQTLALRAVGGRTAKSESNFFSSIGRIQAGATGKAGVMLLGSSITGRLPDRAQGFDGWANLGCDGGSAVDVLRAMNEGILPRAPLLVIEANTLQLALNEKPTEITAAMRGPWFKVGLNAPCLAAYARPSAFFYSKLLARRIGGFESGAGTGDLEVTDGPEWITMPHDAGLTPRQGALIQEVSNILQRMKASGTDSIFVWLPPARAKGSNPPDWILELARTSGSRYWDLGQKADSKWITLTDGVHMAAPSAARTINSLLKAIY